MSPAYHLTYSSPAHSHWYASRYLSRRRLDPHHASCDKDRTFSFSVTLVLDFDLQLYSRGRAAASVRQAVSARSLLHVVGVTQTMIALHREVGVGMFLVAVACS